MEAREVVGLAEWGREREERLAGTEVAEGGGVGGGGGGGEGMEGKKGVWLGVEVGEGAYGDGGVGEGEEAWKKDCWRERRRVGVEVVGERQRRRRRRREERTDGGIVLERVAMGW